MPTMVKAEETSVAEEEAMSVKGRFETSGTDVNKRKSKCTADFECVDIISLCRVRVISSSRCDPAIPK